MKLLIIIVFTLAAFSGLTFPVFAAVPLVIATYEVIVWGIPLLVVAFGISQASDNNYDLTISNRITPIQMSENGEDIVTDKKGVIGAAIARVSNPDSESLYAGKPKAAVLIAQSNSGAWGYINAYPNMASCLSALELFTHRDNLSISLIQRDGIGFSHDDGVSSRFVGRCDWGRCECIHISGTAR